MSLGTASLAGQRVWVVGASSGIGREVALLANSLGAELVLSSRSLAALEAVREALPNPMAVALLPLDYLDARQVREQVLSVGRLDHVVVPAVADENKKRGRFVELSDETMRASFDKFWGQVHVAQAAAPKLTRAGSITLFSSVAALKPPGPQAGLSVMNAAQAAVATLGQSLALELAPVRVNVVLPGLVLTNVWTAEENERNRAWAESSLPARHAGTARDIAEAVLFLMTNRYVTGTLQVIDGGLSRL